MKFSLNFKKKKKSYTKIKDADILDEKKNMAVRENSPEMVNHLIWKKKILLWKQFSIAYRAKAPHNLRYFRQSDSSLILGIFSMTSVVLKFHIDLDDTTVFVLLAFFKSSKATVSS